MNLIKMLAVLFSLILLISSCSAQKDDNNYKISGHWELITSEAQVELHIRSDSTFHVDVMENDGIEVEGQIILTKDKITFINVQGTDSVSSDPTPGTYKYSLNENTLQFEKIDDPILRRANFLSKKWHRIE
jgi:hypothetical protein